MPDQNPAPPLPAFLQGGERSIRLATVALAFVVAGIDQLTKAWAKTLAAPVEIAPFLDLDLSFNRGVTFGLLSADGETGRWLLVALTGVIAAAVLIAAWRTRRRPLALALGAVAGGALGNIIDRVRQGAVTDFLDLHLGDWRWPTFNLADAAIVCGVATLLWLSARTGRSKT